MHDLEGTGSLRFRQPFSSESRRMHVFQEHNACVILSLPTSDSCVLQSVDVCWANDVKAKLAEDLNAYLRKPEIEEAVFRELRDGMLRSPDRLRVASE
jgi:hypothetical protein